MGAWNFEILVKDSNTGGPSSFTVRMEYLFAFQFWKCKFFVKNRWGGRGGGGGGGGGGAESIILLILVICCSFTCRWARGCGLGRKSNLGPAEISSFSSRDLSWRNKHDSLWLVVSTGYFYISFLWTIVVSDFSALEIYNYLLLPLFSITFTANSQADNHFYKYIYLFQYYTVWNLFFIKIHAKVFGIQVWFKCEIPSLFFCNRRHGLQKKLLKG